MTPKPIATKVAIRPDSPLRFTLHTDRNDTAPTPPTVQLHAVVKDQTGDPFADAAVSWSSSRTDIASVDSSGVVTPHAVGTCSLIATAHAVGADNAVLEGRVQCEVDA